MGPKTSQTDEPAQAAGQQQPTAGMEAIRQAREGEGLPFGVVIEHLKQAHRYHGTRRRFYRAGWNGKGLSISLQSPDANSYHANTLPYLYLELENGDRLPWVASNTDLLAEDWFEAM